MADRYLIFFTRTDNGQEWVVPEPKHPIMPAFTDDLEVARIAAATLEEHAAWGHDFRVHRLVCIDAIGGPLELRGDRLSMECTGGITFRTEPIPEEDNGCEHFTGRTQQTPG